ncbi:hypothetical protein ACN2XU_02210 [Primorskyibacter sp. 2E107]|uniref:hypothetical protein n=1 Tax=Primorskyibacter sp. 2E107 TaxID=3403458 RepID=UPI003AF9070A
MIRLPLTALTLLALAGCTDGPAPSASSAPGAAVAQLQPGMTEEQAFAILGPEVGYVRNPANWDQACLSYGSAGAYIHAVFENGALIRSSAGNPALCSFGT